VLVGIVPVGIAPVGIGTASRSLRGGHLGIHHCPLLFTRKMISMDSLTLKTYIKTPNSFNFVAMATRVGRIKI